jgi:3-oxoacyl-[acyl-carrier-protein] synthase II
MTRRRVMITGLGWATSLGHDVPQVWSDLLAGRSGIGPIQRFDVSDYTVKFGGELSDWDQNAPHLERRDFKRFDRFAQFAVSAAITATQDAGLEFDKEDLTRCGVIIGSGIGGIAEFEKGCEQLLKRGPRRVSPFVVPKMMANAAAANVSMNLGLQGPNLCAVTACASAGHSITDAMKTIYDGEADVVVSGGSEAALTPLGLASFMTLKALSTRNDEPERASRPFDADRNGFVLSEGAGILILEEYEHAKKRGAEIYAELIGYGMSADAGHITSPDEQGRGAQHSMRMALGNSGIKVEDISYINAHGTSTPAGDAAENFAVKAVFGEQAYKLTMSSTKSMTGHLLGASGGIETIIAAKVIQTGDIPPTINLENPGEGFDLNYAANEAQQRDVKCAMTNSFGFGGHNSTLILAKV